MQYIGDLAYLFSIHVNVSTFIQSTYRIQDTTLSHIFAAYFWLGARLANAVPRVTGPVMEVYSRVVQLGSLSWVWGHVVGLGKILNGLCCSDPNGVVDMLSGPSSYDWRTFMRECPRPPYCFSLSVNSLVDGCHYGKAHVGSFTNWFLLPFFT